MRMQMSDDQLYRFSEIRDSDAGQFVVVYRSADFRIDERRTTVALCACQCGGDSAGAVDSTVKPQFSDDQHGDVRIPICPHDCDGKRYRDGKVDLRASFRQVCGRKIYKYPFLRELEAAVAKRGADSMSGFLDGTVRQSHNVETGKPIAKVSFDPYLLS
jgi:hypothetical protein